MAAMIGFRAPRRVLATAAAALLAGVPIAGSASAAQVSWDPVAHPSTSGKTQRFFGVDAAGVDDVWLVGDSFGVVGGALEFRTLAQHWDGASWSRVPTPDVETAPAKDILFDVSAAAPSDVWAVGLSATAVGNAASKPLAEHWNGSQWSIVALPPTPANSSLSAVAARGQTVWALGDQYNPQSGYYKPLILLRQGGGWIETPLPATAGCNAATDGSFQRFDPGGITISAGGVAFLSGTCTSPAGDRAVLARYRRGSWRSAIDPSTLPSPSRLEDVDAALNAGVRAVGAAGTAGLILGASGVTEEVPTLGSGIGLNSVTGRGDHYIAVGSYSSGDAFARPALLRRAGGQWRSESVSISYGNPLGATVDPAGQAWAVGVSVTDDKGLILKRAASP